MAGRRRDALSSRGVSGSDSCLMGNADKDRNSSQERHTLDVEACEYSQVLRTFDVVSREETRCACSQK